MSIASFTVLHGPQQMLHDNKSNLTQPDQFPAGATKASQGLKDDDPLRPRGSLGSGPLAQPWRRRRNVADFHTCIISGKKFKVSVGADTMKELCLLRGNGDALL